MTYGLADDVIERIRQVLATHPEVERAILYGSRAKGTFRAGSDIDLSLEGETLTVSQMLAIENELDDLLLPHKIDLSLVSHIDDPDLRAHLARVGQVFYDQASTKANP